MKIIRKGFTLTVTIAVLMFCVKLAEPKRVRNITQALDDLIPNSEPEIVTLENGVSDSEISFEYLNKASEASPTYLTFAGILVTLSLLYIW